MKKAMDGHANPREPRLLGGGWPGRQPNKHVLQARMCHNMLKPTQKMVPEA